jgi:membrane-bound serine protease (ClpP class)
MKSTIRRVVSALLLVLITYVASAADNTVVVLEIDGGIGVATADYLEHGIQHAAEQNAELIIIDMDTPGGLMGPTRDIIQAILGSPVPVATFVTPAGARADSAGTYILLASHIAAMAPTTHLGAATPVSLSGDQVTPDPVEDSADEAENGKGSGDTDEDSAADDVETGPTTDPGTAMERKVLNDAVAYIRGLAERHGRNADWAEDAVRDAATLTADEALEMNVIEFIADDHPDLLAQVNGHEIEIDSEPVALATENATIENFEPNWRIRILSAIANPEIVLLLGIIGLYGLMYEGWNPGAIVPGVVGVICLLLAAYALQVLPVNYAGLALIIVGLALMTRPRRYRRICFRRHHDVRQRHPRIRHFDIVRHRPRTGCCAGHHLAGGFCAQTAQAWRRNRIGLDRRRDRYGHARLHGRRQGLARRRSLGGA